MKNGGRHREEGCRCEMNEAVFHPLTQAEGQREEREREREEKMKR